MQFYIFTLWMPWSMSTYTRIFIRWKYTMAWNEKRKKILGFSYIYYTPNFETFVLNISLSKNLSFLKGLGAENPLRLPFNIRLKKYILYIPSEFESGITIQPAVVASLHLLHDQLRILPNHLGEFSVFCPVLFRPELFPNRRK